MRFTKTCPSGKEQEKENQALGKAFHESIVVIIIIVVIVIVNLVWTAAVLLSLGHPALAGTVLSLAVIWPRASRFPLRHTRVSVRLDNANQSVRGTQKEWKGKKKQGLVLPLGRSPDVRFRA
jgi:hypothetical protein